MGVLMGVRTLGVENLILTSHYPHDVLESMSFVPCGLAARAMRVAALPAKHHTNK